MTSQPNETEAAKTIPQLAARALLLAQRNSLPDPIRFTVNEFSVDVVLRNRSDFTAWYRTLDPVGHSSGVHEGEMSDGSITMNAPITETYVR